MSADFFGKIASRQAAESVRLVGPLPPQLEETILPLDGRGHVAASPEASPGALRRDWERAMRRLRRRSVVFERDLSPWPAAERPSIKLSEAQWRVGRSGAFRQVSLPHYEGPVGRAISEYRMDFALAPELLEPGRLFACFQSVDYKAEVFVNGRFVGQHEGFFSPFEFDITDRLNAGQNQMHVMVVNDFCSHGQPVDGDKIYAATGPGWDEPGVGWHHCPPGMGISGAVSIEARPTVFLSDIFVRTLDLDGAAELRLEVFNTSAANQPLTIDYSVCGQNFQAEVIRDGQFPELPEAGPGVSYYRVEFQVPKPRLWSPETPWLYRAQVTLRHQGKQDFQTRQFGLRTFEQQVEREPRGCFFLNGNPIRLRGANTMGHEQQCVMKGNWQQLREDLLIAKAAHLNFLRLTQRPVQREIYEMCERLGVMTQTDLPLFGHLRRNQFAEAVRQAGEMERLVRGYACNVVVSFINEPFPKAWGDKSHRNLTRPELESFFVAASEMVLLENPDRVIKPVDGDYDPPGPGLPDNHCYPAWYNGHAIDLGKLHKGFWQAVKPGWFYACGEFGAEGLDDAKLMRRRYPAHWLPEPGREGDWTPAQIPYAQTANLQACWFDPQHSLEDWVAASQEHQRWATRIMTEAFRRDARMVSFAIHLLIDAFPAGWMKTLVDCERNPKPAYFAYRDALTPLMANLRLDRLTFFAGEMLRAEAWICNDRNDIPAGARLAYEFSVGGRRVSGGNVPATIRPGEPVFQGYIDVPLPQVDDRTPSRLALAILLADGQAIHSTQAEVTLFPSAAGLLPGGCVVGRTDGDAGRLFRELNLPSGRDVLLIDDPAAFRSRQEEILDVVGAGATAVFLRMPPGTLEIGPWNLTFEKAGMNPRYFVSRATGHPWVAGYQARDFSFWHDPDLDRPAPLLETVAFAEGWRPILLTGQGDWGKPFCPALAAAEVSLGRGRLVVCQVALAGRVLTNPVARAFAVSLLDARDSKFSGLVHRTAQGAAFIPVAADQNGFPLQGDPALVASELSVQQVHHAGPEEVGVGDRSG